MTWTARVGRSGTQLVVLQLAFLNKLLIADVLEVDTDKLLGKLFRDSVSKIALQGLVVEACVCVVVCTVLSYPSIGLGQEVEGRLVLAGEECQGVRRGLVEHGGSDT